MHDGFHFVPLIEFQSILSNISAEGRGGVTVGSVPFRQLCLIVNTIGLHEALEMAPRLVESVLHLIYK